jgi:hypothetical protein
MTKGDRTMTTHYGSERHLVDEATDLRLHLEDDHGKEVSAYSHGELVDLHAECHADDKKRQGRNPLRLVCACRSVRVFPEAMDVGPIICGACGKDFE